jgi:hypothetical protein
MFPLSGQVKDLLRTRFEEIEKLWDAQPESEPLAAAATVKAFMGDHQITAVAEGVAAFERFKEAQARLLTAVGLSTSRRPPCTSRNVVDPAPTFAGSAAILQTS